MYIIIDEGYYVLSDTNRIGKISSNAKVYYTTENVARYAEGEFYDAEGNKIENIKEVTDDYIDLNALLPSQTIEPNKQYELTLPKGVYKLFKDGVLINLFTLEETKKLKVAFKATGAYVLEMEDRPFNPAYFVVAEPLIEVIEIG